MASSNDWILSRNEFRNGFPCEKDVLEVGIGESIRKITKISIGISIHNLILFSGTLA